MEISLKYKIFYYDIFTCCVTTVKMTLFEYEIYWAYIIYIQNYIIICDYYSATYVMIYRKYAGDYYVLCNCENIFIFTPII